MWLSLFFNSLQEREQTKTIIFSASPYGMPVISHHYDANNKGQNFESRSKSTSLFNA